MKKIICLMLCVLMLSVSLTGCGKDVIGEDLDGYYEEYQPEVKEETVLDFYIICNEGTTENATVTVERWINNYLKDKYNTTLDMHYLTADEYLNVVKEDANKSGEERADIVLVSGKDMFDELHKTHTFANLNEFMNNNKFGTLNTQITKTLLDGSLMDEFRYTHKGVKYDVQNRYFVPNNHVIGTYEYLLIDKETAKDFAFSERKFNELTSYEDTLEFRNLLTENGLDAEKLVKQVSGVYADKAEFEKNGYMCKVIKYPTVDANEAFKAGFAIVRAENDTSYDRLTDIDPSADPETIEKYDTSYLSHYERCMEIIFAFNADETLRNLLQYGVLGTNYSVDEQGVVTSVNEGDAVYNMNIEFTGDVFKALYNTNGWNKEVANSASNQNAESVLFNSESEK